MSDSTLVVLTSNFFKGLGKQIRKTEYTTNNGQDYLIFIEPDTPVSLTQIHIITIVT